MKRKLFIAVLLLAAAQLSAQTLTVKNCIEFALKNNLPVKQGELRMEAAAINYQQAKANLLPNLSGNIGYGFNKGRTVDPQTNSYINRQLASSNVNVNSGVVLFNGSRLQHLINQSKFSYEATAMDWQQIKDNLALNVILAYLQVLNNQDALAIAKNQLQVTQKQVERTEVLAKEGAVGNYQLTDLRGQQANEELTIITLENSIQQSKLALSQLMNTDYNPAMELERIGIEEALTNYPLTAKEVIESSFQNLAMVKANEWREKAAAKAIRATTASFSPTLSLNANMNSNYSSLARSLTANGQVEVPTGDYVYQSSVQNPVLRREQSFTAQKVGYGTQLNNNLGTFAGLNLSIPIFNNFRVRNQVKLAKIELKNTELESDRVKLDLKRGIEQEWLNMSGAYSRYKILLQQEVNFAESFRAAEIRFASGVINAYEFLMAKNNLDRARVNLSQAKYDYLFRTRLLDYYAGKQIW